MEVVQVLPFQASIGASSVSFLFSNLVAIPDSLILIPLRLEPGASLQFLVGQGGMQSNFLWKIFGHRLEFWPFSWSGTLRPGMAEAWWF